ncbi:MAG: XdhC family protein [Dehalococcoidia bacterium]
MVPLLLGLATIVALLTLAGLFARRDPDVHTLMFRIEALPHGLRGRLGVWIARDREASALVRFLPLTAFVYWVTPLDLIPDFIPGIGFFDDRLVLALALWCVGRVSRGSPRRTSPASSSSATPPSKRLVTSRPRRRRLPPRPAPIRSSHPRTYDSRVNADLARDITEAIQAALEGGPPAVVATVTRPGSPALPLGAKLLVRSDGSVVGAIRDDIDAMVAQAAIEQLRTLPRIMVETLWIGDERGVTTRRSQAADDAATIMVELFEAPARLLVVGGGHVGLAVATLGELSGMSVSVFDDREEFANVERFPMADRVFAGDTARALDEFGIGGSDYIVLVSRGHQLDELALRHSVAAGAAYVGMIGSRRRTSTILEHLRAEGIDPRALERVRTPIGIDIGAETPEEIAVSILAEIIMVRRGGSGALMSAGRSAQGS